MTRPSPRGERGRGRATRPKPTTRLTRPVRRADQKWPCTRRRSTPASAGQVAPGGARRSGVWARLDAWTDGVLAVSERDLAPESPFHGDAVRQFRRCGVLGHVARRLVDHDLALRRPTDSAARQDLAELRTTRRVDAKQL